jgi:hypothetical protein
MDGYIPQKSVSLRIINQIELNGVVEGGVKGGVE